MESESLASLSLGQSGYSFVIVLANGKYDSETTAMIVSFALSARKMIERKSLKVRGLDCVVGKGCMGVMAVV